MKIILSRKGFDSGYGGCASPIFQDDSMGSFPIPYKGAGHNMNEVVCDAVNLGNVAQNLTRRRSVKNQVGPHTAVHLDPDLSRPEARQLSGWRPAFGQDGAAQTHLCNQGVGIGDLFLFFGWFRRVQQSRLDGKWLWDFDAGARDVHVIFGWLQVGEKLHIGASPSRDSYPSWLEDHPHIQNAKDCPIKNTVYVASRNLVVNGEMLQRHGGGVFPKYSVARQLTHPHGLGRSTWLLPDWFNPFVASRRPSLTYHPNRKSWGAPGDAAGQVTLKAAHIGQEFVLDTASYPEALPWLKGLFDWHK